MLISTQNQTNTESLKLDHSKNSNRHESSYKTNSLTFFLSWPKLVHNLGKMILMIKHLNHEVSCTSPLKHVILLHPQFVVVPYRSILTIPLFFMNPVHPWPSVHVWHAVGECVDILDHPSWSFSEFISNPNISGIRDNGWNINPPNDSLLIFFSKRLVLTNSKGLMLRIFLLLFQQSHIRSTILTPSFSSQLRDSLCILPPELLGPTLGILLSLVSLLESFTNLRCATITVGL